VSLDKWGSLAREVAKNRYLQVKSDGTKETWAELAHRVAHTVLSTTTKDKDLIALVEGLIRDRKFLPGGRYLAATGKAFHQTQNCALFRAEDSREGWSDLMQKSTMSLMTGAGIGCVYSDLRESGAVIKKTGGVASGPLALMQMVNESGRFIRQGGNRRAAIWGGLRWNHPDIDDFTTIKNWSPEIVALKLKDYDNPAPLDMTNISTILDTEFFCKFESDESHTRRRFYKTLKQAMSTGDPGFSIDAYKNEGENLRNACTEITSSDDSDICNLGSLNMARFDNLPDFKQAVQAATAFLLAGTVYSDVPTEKIRQIRDKNRRLGLGLMGVAEWLLVRGKPYGDDEELNEWGKAYKEEADDASKAYANLWNLSTPVKNRALAPNGTIGIVGETTTCIEPILCVAYRRSYFTDGKKRAIQYVVDPTAERLIKSGIDPDKIEDAYELSKTPERRVAFQAWVQQFVDHAISSTVNLAPWGSEWNNEDRVKPMGKMLMKYLKDLRGITFYPDGARSGQPLVPVSYQTALKHKDEIIYEQADICDIRGGSCGS
jgi:ribonucleoside-diphosphate reductase alpha chain